MLNWLFYRTSPKSSEFSLRDKFITSFEIKFGSMSVPLREKLLSIYNEGESSLRAQVLREQPILNQEGDVFKKMVEANVEEKMTGICPLMLALLKKYEKELQEIHEKSVVEASWKALLKKVAAEFGTVAAPIIKELERYYDTLNNKVTIVVYMKRVEQVLFSPKNKEELKKNAQKIVFEPEIEKVYRKAWLDRDWQAYEKVKNDPKFAEYRRRLQTLHHGDPDITAVQAKENLECLIANQLNIALDQNVKFLEDGRTIRKDNEGIFWMNYYDANKDLGEATVTFISEVEVDEKGNVIPNGREMFI